MLHTTRLSSVSSVVACVVLRRAWVTGGHLPHVYLLLPTPFTQKATVKKIAPQMLKVSRTPSFQTMTRCKDGNTVQSPLHCG